MDTSKQYFQMCATALEIQKYKINKTDYFEAGDYFIEEMDEFDSSMVVISRGVSEMMNSVGYNITWLPRQDQLQQIFMDKQEVGKLHNSVIGFYNFCIRSRGYKKPSMLQKFNSLEQLWLSFVMEKVYNKVWKGKNWEAIK